ncbi:MAG TPA: ABC transporter ATP-binding protein [Candidatus Paceibacterota bacterium]|nr:ABC transporter ATP-binding protein [Candidatus Paceibacterota bacterium]
MIKFLRQLWPFMKPYRNRLILGLICGVVFGLLQAVLIFLVNLVVNLAFNGQMDFAEQIQKATGMKRWVLDHLADWLPQIKAPDSKLGMVLIILLIPAIMLIRAVFGYLNVYMTNWAALRAVADLRTKLFNHLQNLSLSFFSSARTGDLISRISSDTQTLYGIMGSSVASMIKDPITIISIFCVLLIPEEQRTLTLLSIVVLPACLVPISLYARRVRKSARAIQTHNSELVTLMHESFTGNRIIKAYNLEATVSEQFKSTTRKYIGQVMRVVRANELPSQFTELLGGVGVALVLIYATVIAKHKVDVGGFVMFILAIVSMYQPIKTLTRLHNQLHQAEAATERIFELLRTHSDVVEPANPQTLQTAQADIRFENVDFNYGEKPVLRDVNLTVKAGQLVALVGSSGSGKTTITNLLLRFYDPQRGSVKIGGTDVRDVTTRDLRRQIALVTQETILFHDTIRKNIALGQPDATADEIEAAARAANAHEFIIQRPEGYDAVVGEKGVNVSGGQRQRIAIARAILKNAPILVLDEATSALDSESERLVQAELEKLMEGRTTLCIAHRLSTVQKADMIVVMSAGRIVETGTHAELLQRGGVYKRLYELQFNG